jgi:glycerol-3-phosphate cytidylyltransferase
MSEKRGRVLYTGGTFDVFHYGHVNFLKQCSLLCDNVVVALNTDEFIAQFKGSTPIMSYRERERSLLNCRYVDRVIPNLSGEDSKPTILSVEPDIVAIGDDWAHKDYYKQMQFTQQWLEEQEIVLVYIPYTRDISTSEIKNRIIQKWNLKK